MEAPICGEEGFVLSEEEENTFDFREYQLHSSRLL